MVFSDIPFLFFFLPPLLLIYFLSPKRWRNGILLLFSLLFYALGDARYLWLMLVSVFGVWLLTLGMTRRRHRKRWLCFAVIWALLPLFFFKYADFFILNWNHFTGMSLSLLRLSLPLGISFYTFQLISYAVDVYRKEVPPQQNPLRLLMYIILFPQLIAGPIVRYREICTALETREHTIAGFADGCGRFAIGLWKKVILANVLGEVVAAYGKAEATMLFTWLYGTALCLQLYLDFSAYSDMAIGLGAMFGFSFPENFRYPYASGSIAEFWRRWHISLGAFFRDYVYIPMGGNRVSRLLWFRNVGIVWFLTGFWHGAGWNFIFWGLYFAVLLLLEKVCAPVLERWPHPLRHTLVLFLLLISFLLFHAGTLQEALRQTFLLFDFSHPWDALSLYTLRSYAFVIAVAIFASTPLPAQLWHRLRERTHAAPWAALLSALAVPAILLWVSAYLVDGSFNPFLYFRF